MENIYERLHEENIEYVKGLSLSTLSSFKVGGIADCVTYPKNETEISKIILLSAEYGVQFEIVGNGSNILFSDSGYDGIIICTKKMTFVSIDNNTITAQCGAKLASLAATARDLSLSGLEFAHGIPGTVGGAIAMNAGAFGGEMSDVVVSSLALDTKSGERIYLEKDQHKFGYRKSIYTENKDLVCLLVNMQLPAGDKSVIETKMKENATARKEKQPLNLPNCGSYFKRPEGYIAAKLIDDLGLKGLSVGGAMVSKKHAGFIVNTQNATASDILSLEEKIKKEVFEHYGIMLEREVKFVE